VFILDSSGSIDAANFQTMLKFVENVTESLTIGPTGTQVGVVRFSSSSNLVIHLDEYDTQSGLGAAISNIVYDAGGTNTADALMLTRRSAFTNQHGARSEAIKVAILVTDGQSNSLQATSQEAEAAKADGIVMFSIGVGGYNRQELDAVSSPPSCTHVFLLTGFSEIDSILHEIRASACSGKYIYISLHIT
jgi:hypothetical protein